jgi:hypothetical protein
MEILLGIGGLLLVVGLFGALSRFEAGQRQRMLQDVTTARPVRRYDLVGEVLPPEESSSLAPWQPGRVVPSYEVQNRQPRGAQTIEGGFLVPLATAAGTAICVTLATGALAWVFGWSVKVVMVTFGLGLLAAWLWRIGVADRLLWGIETWTKTDLDGDGRTGRPAAHLATMQPEAARATVARTVRAAAESERLVWLQAFVHRCYTVGCSESAQGIKPGERAQYLEARDLLLRLGVAVWRDAANKRLGWVLAADEPTAQAIIAEHVTAL